MNSLNFFATRVTSQHPPTQAQGERRRSYSEGNLKRSNSEEKVKRSFSYRIKRKQDAKENTDGSQEKACPPSETPHDSNEKSSLIKQSHSPKSTQRHKSARKFIQAISSAVKWILSTLGAPVIYIIRGFRDERGHYSLLLPLGCVRSSWSKHSHFETGKQKATSPGSAGMFSFAGGRRRTLNRHARRWERLPLKERFIISSTIHHQDLVHDTECF